MLMVRRGSFGSRWRELLVMFVDLVSSRRFNLLLAIIFSTVCRDQFLQALEDIANFSICRPFTIFLVRSIKKCLFKVLSCETRSLTFIKAYTFCWKVLNMHNKFGELVSPKLPNSPKAMGGWLIKYYPKQRYADDGWTDRNLDKYHQWVQSRLHPSLYFLHVFLYHDAFIEVEFMMGRNFSFDPDVYSCFVARIFPEFIPLVTGDHWRRNVRQFHTTFRYPNTRREEDRVAPAVTEEERNFIVQNFSTFRIGTFRVRISSGSGIQLRHSHDPVMRRFLDIVYKYSGGCAHISMDT